jgi:transcription elongation factor GreA
MSNKEPITQRGFADIEAELSQLIKVDRENIKKAISTARELGDLKENAEYHSAKEKQSLIEGRIAQLQAIVANSNIVDIKAIQTESIVFGASVKLTDVEKDETVSYQVVGQHESDINKGRVSYKSPLGQALLGKEEGDTVIVKAPKGDIEYEVEEVEYAKS